MSLKVTASGFLIFLLSLPGFLQGQKSWGVNYTSTEICAVKGSAVDLHCTCTYPSSINGRNTTVTQILWFINGPNHHPQDLSTDPNYSGRVEYLRHDGNKYTLRITDLRESDSAEYKFRFITNQQEGRYTGSPGVTLKVTDFQVQVEGSSTQLAVKCRTTCDLPGQSLYIWYNYGQKMDEETSSHPISVNDNDSYSCGFRRQEDYSPPVYMPKVPSVSVCPSGEIVEGSSVTLSCSSDANPAATYTWYKKNQHRQSLSREPQLVIRHIQSLDSGEYYCKVENKLGNRTSESISVDVKYAPKLPSVSVSPSGEIMEGSSVNLTCSSDANPAANYTWYKENQTLLQTPGGSYHFPSISPEDGGHYHCKSENKYGRINSSSLFINVQYAPKLPSLSLSPSGEIMEGSTVTLTCSSDANPAANYTWYKENLLQTPVGSYHFTSISPEDGGHYHCKSENKYGRINSSSLFINVQYAPKLPSVSVSPSAEIVEGSSVTLTCSSDANPAANYSWFKDSRTLIRGPAEKVHFPSISSEDSGIYHCKSENKYGQNSSSLIIDVQYAPKLPSLLLSPPGDIMEGSTVNLTCSSDANPAANYTWYKENQTLLQTPQGSYHFPSISPEDGGHYHCNSENKYGHNSSSLFINVQYAPKLPSLSLSPPGEIMEGSTVNLTCSSDANPAANYTWYKENQTLLQTPQGSYHFPSISPEDGGHYHCKSENKYGHNSSSLAIDVEYAPKPPTVSVSPSAKTVEGSTLNLTCSSDANPAANYTWYKENDDSPKASGQIFTITDIRFEHSGIYYCKAQNRRGDYNTTLDLNVVAGAWKSIVAATVPAILLVILLTSVFLWIIKKRASKQTSEAAERPDDREQIQPAEQRGEIEYTAVYFSNKQADPIYSNIRPAKPQRHNKNDEEEMVEYAGVAFNSASRSWRTRGLEATEEPAAVYSKINRFHKKHGQRNL